jgi:outer membrane protein assembly factor BamB
LRTLYTALVAFACTLALLAAAGSAVAAAPVSWTTYGFDAQRTGYNPDETAIGVGNAGELHEAWSAGLGAVAVAQPVVAAGVEVGGVARNVVYEGSEHGLIFALNAANGHLLWQKRLGSVRTDCYDMPDKVFGIGGAGAISFTGAGTGVIYVAGGDGSVHALDLATGAEQPGWPVTSVFNASREHVYGGLNLFDGRLYVTVASHCEIQPYNGRVVAIDVASHTISNVFYAIPPTDGVSGGGIWGPGGVSIDPATGDVFTGTGNADTTPDNFAFSDSILELSSTLSLQSAERPELTGTDRDFGSTPIVYRPAGCPTNLVTAMNKSGALFTYSEGDVLGKTVARRFQVADINDDEFIGVPAWDPVTNMLYVSNSSDSTTNGYKHGLIAFESVDGCELKTAWHQTVGPNYTPVSPPTVANGVVYYGDGDGNTEYAFDAATGKQLWNSGSTLGGNAYAAPTVVNGELLVASWDHRLYAFTP